MSSSRDTVIADVERLAKMCRKLETNLLIGKLELSLTDTLIHCVFNDNNNSRDDNKNNYKYNYLKQLFRKIPQIKITSDNIRLTTDLMKISVDAFESCLSLQLIRIAFNRLDGLDQLRPHVKTLNCLKCFDTQLLDEDFWQKFGVWPQLTSLKLSHNNIISIKGSMVPTSVTVLDLSWNHIKLFTNIANYSVIAINKLDLSYNCLLEVPKLNTICCLSLRSLYIRQNLIEAIDGIEKFTNLEELDIGNNCMIDLNKVISCLKKCKSLRSLWIDGNPFACDRKAIVVIHKELPFLLKLNEIVNRNQSIVEALDNKSDIVRDSNLMTKSTDDESELYFDASCDSMDCSLISGSVKNGVNKKKKHRIVEIKDQTDISDDIESKPWIHKNDDNLNEAQELIQKRKEGGDEWLISLKPSLENTSYIKQIFENNGENTSALICDFNSLDFNISSPIAVSTPRIDRKVSLESNTTNDDGIDIITEPISNWTDKELENDTNIIIVDNLDNNETIFVYVSEEDGILFEKDSEGKMLRTHDLKVLINVEIINNVILKMRFDTKVSFKREVRYQFNNTESCLAFNEKFIIPWLSKKRLIVKKELLYQCLECGQTKRSSFQELCCGICGSNSMVKNNDNNHKLYPMKSPQNQTDSEEEEENQTVVESNVWEELCSIDSSYDNSFFTSVEHSLKLYIEVKLFSSTSEEEEEVLEALIKCRTLVGNQKHLESSYLVISNKNILIIAINENEDYDNLDAYLRLVISKPISTISNVKDLPILLAEQGFWIEFRNDGKELEQRSKSKSFLNRFGSVKKSSSADSYSLYTLIVFFDDIIGKSFITYFKESTHKSLLIHNYQNKNEKIIFENPMPFNDDIIIIYFIKSAQYKRVDMKSELILQQNICVIVTEEMVILGELIFEANNDYKIKALYKEMITNLNQEVLINLQSKSFKLIFCDDNIETQFTINLYTNDMNKKLLTPIKSQWEKAFDIPLTIKKI